MAGDVRCRSMVAPRSSRMVKGPLMHHPILCRLRMHLRAGPADLFHPSLLAEAALHAMVMALAPTHRPSPAAILQTSAAQVDAGPTASAQTGSPTMASLARSEHRETGAATASSWRLRLLSSASVTPSTLAPKVAMGRTPALAMSSILSLPRVMALC